MAEPAPIALFVYNRPEHTRATLESLARNRLADRSTLWIFADGPPEAASPELRESIARVRRAIRESRWCRHVEICESPTNRGLAASIIAGVSRVCDEKGRAIVLEDDLETSPGFLEYMNAALDRYSDEPRVHQVSGFNVRMPLLPPAAATGFLRVTTSWGWATWQTSWRHYDDDAAGLLERVRAKDPVGFDLGGTSFHLEELERNVCGDLRTWAVRWYASVFARDGLALYPRRTLVRNLGFDGSGVHCHDDSSHYHRRLRLAGRIPVRPRIPGESPAYLRAMQRHYRAMIAQWKGTRLRDRLERKFRSALDS